MKNIINKKNERSTPRNSKMWPENKMSLVVATNAKAIAVISFHIDIH